MGDYAVDRRDSIPTLIRWAAPYIYTFDPSVEGEWVESPGKRSMLWDQGDFVWYDDISDEEAEKYMAQIREDYHKRTVCEEEYPGIPRAEFDEAVALFLENPYWREYYETAPGEACRKYIAMEFYLSEHEIPEAEEVLNEMEEKLSSEDWKHLLKYCGNNPRKGYIMKKIRAMTGMV